MTAAVESHSTPSPAITEKLFHSSLVIVEFIEDIRWPVASSPRPPPGDGITLQDTPCMVSDLTSPTPNQKRDPSRCAVV